MMAIGPPTKRNAVRSNRWSSTGIGRVRPMALTNGPGSGQIAILGPRSGCSAAWIGILGTCFMARSHHHHHVAQAQIPIAPAAPSALHLPRFRPLASCRRRLLARVEASLWPASATLHTGAASRAAKSPSPLGQMPATAQSP
jgi:hypothetical protein